MNKKKISIDDIKEYITNHDIPMAPTQSKLCVPIINRIYLKMVNGLRFDDIKIFDDLIIDGHHRYISSLLANKSISAVPSQKTVATKAHKWSSLGFVETEWDTADKIDKLNKDDADFNGISLEKVYEMTR